MAKQQKPALSDLENKVMAILWEQWQSSADDVRTELQEVSPMKDSTVRTILRRLEEKGYVTHRTEGRTYFYSPIVKSQHVAAEAVQRIVQRFCNGSVEDLLVGLVDSEILSAAKLSELAKKISDAKAKDQPKSQSRRPKGV